MTADDVQAAARAWLGVPFLHQGRSTHGVDCAGLLILIGRELGIVAADWDVPPYPRMPDGRTLRRLCDERLTRSAAPEAGGAVLIAWGDGPPQHLGIVTRRGDLLAMVHAEGVRRHRVVETRLIFGRVQRLVQSYRLPGVEYAA